MNDSVQDRNQNTPIDSPQPAIQQQVSHISFPGKEHVPSGGGRAEFIQSSETDPVIAPELKEAGVEVVKSEETPRLSQEVAQAGVVHAKSATLLNPAPARQISLPEENLPLSEPEAVEIVKNKSVSESVRWLAVFVLRQVKKAHRGIMDRIQ